LEDLVSNSESFQSVIATGALDGLSEMTKDEGKSKEIYVEVANFLLQNTSNSKDYFLRAKSTRLLGKLLTNKFDSADDEIVEFNQKIFYRLRELTKDERRKIKMNACEALSDDEAKFIKIPGNITFESIQILVEVAKEDLDGFVRRKAETSANRIREWIHKWSSSPLSIDEGPNTG
jgi:aminopeptidase N